MFLKDLTSEDINTYKYALIQLHFPQTYEIFNLGVILFDKKNIKIKVISNIHKLKDCLRIKDMDSIKFSLTIISNRILYEQNVIPGKISSSIFITEIRCYTSAEPLDIAIDTLFEETITIVDKIHKKKDINFFDKPHILANIKHIIKEKSFEDICFNKRINCIEKNIDLLAHKTNEYNKKVPILAAEIVSPFVHNFFKNTGESLLALQQTSLIPSIKFKIIYMPRLSQIDTKQLSVFRIVKKITSNNNIYLCDSKDPNEFIYKIEELTFKYTQKLF